jgi:hypothetical protein
MNMKCDTEIQLIALVDWIEKQYHTGSRVIGGYTETSDYDYVAEWDIATPFLANIGLQLPPKDKCEHPDYAGSKRFYSFKYRRNEQDQWTNLIVVPDHDDFNAWRSATDTLMGSEFTEQAARRKTMFGWALNDAYNRYDLPERAKWPDAFTWSMDQDKELTAKEQVGLECLLSTARETE